MNDKQYIVKYKFFLIHMYKEEEAWLEYMSSMGYHLVSVFFGFRFTFVKGEPAKYKYSLDYRKSYELSSDYLQLFEDAGWQYIGSYLRWHYFRTSKCENTVDIFSDSSDIIERNRNLISLTTILLGVILTILLLNTIAIFAGNSNRTFSTLVAFVVSFTLYTVRKNLIKMNRDLE